MMMTEDKKVITIDDKDYTDEQLTEKQRMFVSQIQSLSQKIASTEFTLDQLKVGKDAFAQMLIVSLKDVSSEGDEGNDKQ